ncbi:MAG: hypothetical protein ACPG1C_05340 [Alphaproteobacteria bacterium]
MTAALHKTGQTLLAALVLLASVCLCMAPLPVAPQLDTAHAHHADQAMTMAMADDMPAPCNETNPPCHVVAEADNIKPAPAIVVPHSVVAITVYAPASVLKTRQPLTRLSHWARPPPDPVSYRDRSLT